ncbi:hypothetical protein PENSPDRAFT_579888 [Peniophora sp. CONT]|nr:hypothetical protein PENSPDRAFT_579888 [Peniophora sp. CONT]
MVFAPPSRYCSLKDCPGIKNGKPPKLTDEKRYDGRAYTLRRGILPIVSKSYYCRHCQSGYYPAYQVRHASSKTAQRVYYEGVPDFIYVSKRSFVERALCDFFEAQLSIGQNSGEQTSRIYNQAMATPTSAASNIFSSIFDTSLHRPLVLDTFFIYALLKDKTFVRNERLMVPNGGSQSDRFSGALLERNLRMAGTGQEMWAHACNLCKKETGDGRTCRFIDAVVMDGVTIGHPCCSVPHCMEALTNQQDRFCADHMPLSSVCAIQGCSAVISGPGSLTCSESSHVAHAMRDKQLNSFSHLKRRAEKAERLKKGLSAQPSYAQTALDRAQDPLPPQSDKPETALPLPLEEAKLRNFLHRRWTHNEQLMLRPCGVCISRASMFTAESMPACCQFGKATFPTHRYPNCAPSYWVFDNACSLRRHIDHQHDTYFDDTALVVDVFHAFTKHKENDAYCQTHCNPALFPDLHSAGSGWTFNTSICEQINRWFGKFQHIVREMSTFRYNFFLDEMLSINNRSVVARLEQQGHQPHHYPLEQLNMYRNA